MKRPRIASLTSLAALSCACLAGCQQNIEPTAAADEGASVTVAEANLEPTEGNHAKGTVTFTAQENGVRVVATLTGLAPGDHGFHVHEHGDCSAPDASSAGGHFNPTGAPHGGPDADQHHVGDLGNITADANGQAKLDRVFSFLELNGPNSIVGRGLIVHAERDDLTSQPTGNAGARLACGVIQATQRTNMAAAQPDAM